ncbi:MAG: DUF5615 family PIN-like protein [Stellaceae bacterium]
MNPLPERISIDPRVCGGKPCIKGTRIWVSLILDFLAEDMTEAELLDQYRGLTHEDVLAAIAYGAEAARECVIPVPTENRGVKFKLDENISRRTADLIRTAGHDGVTVANQGLRGAADETLFEVCRRESRVLVTVRIVSGRFQRGMKLKNIRTGRLMSVQAPRCFSSPRAARRRIRRSHPARRRAISGSALARSRRPHRSRTLPR